MYPRKLAPSQDYSFFLFGARSTGKSTFLSTFLPPEQVYLVDLLDISLEDRLAKKPQLLTQILESLDSSIKYVVIDEVQKLPRLLDLVHQFMTQHKGRFVFILTGSSAKKLKHGGANLLAGRAFVFFMFPLTFLELGEDFELNHYLHFGGLPEVYSLKTDSSKKKYLKAYTLTYLKEEIWNEHLVRKLEPFRKFLELAAQQNTEIINYSKIARHVGVDKNTVQAYFQLLEETHIGFLLEAYHPSVRKRYVHAPKFYFFDTGVVRSLTNQLDVPMTPGSYAYGKFFEHFVICQIIYLANYLEKDFEFFYFKTESGVEVDLVVQSPSEGTTLLEIKSSSESHLEQATHLIQLKDEWPDAKRLCLSQDPLQYEEKGVRFLPWRDGISEVLGL